MAGYEWITFTSDYGLEDHFVGVCHGVMARVAPGVRVIDVSHGVAAQDVRAGAVMLAQAVPYLPRAVHLAVVDPGVGTSRGMVAVEAGGQVLVGPDNGLLVWAADALGGVERVVDLQEPAYRLEPVSRTFHGRDVFAPVAAALALGADLDEVGDALAPDSLAQLEQPQPTIETGRRVVAPVAYVDRFGNVALVLSERQAIESGLKLGHRLWVEAGGVTLDAVYAVTFADVPAEALLLYLDSYRNLALAVNRGSAAERLGLAPGDEVVLRPA